MRTNRLFDGGILIIIGIIIVAVAAAGGFSGLRDGQNRCLAYKAAYDEWVKEGRPGGDSAERRAETLYGVSRAICLRRGVAI